MMLEVKPCCVTIGREQNEQVVPIYQYYWCQSYIPGSLRASIRLPNFLQSIMSACCFRLKSITAWKLTQEDAFLDLKNNNCHGSSAQVLNLYVSRNYCRKKKKKTPKKPYLDVIQFTRRHGVIPSFAGIPLWFYNHSNVMLVFAPPVRKLPV